VSADPNEQDGQIRDIVLPSPASRPIPFFLNLQCQILGIDKNPCCSLLYSHAEILLVTEVGDRRSKVTLPTFKG
jgi:hypothetical protein